MRAVGCPSIVVGLVCSRRVIVEMMEIVARRSGANVTHRRRCCSVSITGATGDAGEVMVLTGHLFCSWEGQQHAASDVCETLLDLALALPWASSCPCFWEAWWDLAIVLQL